MSTTRSKKKFYRTAIRPALLYGTMLGYKEISWPEDERKPPTMDWSYAT